MNYARHYEALIARGAARRPPLYGERHHIVPRCMGGSDAVSNIVSLTAEEHYVAHQLLVKMHPAHAGLAVAANIMAKRAGNSKAYGWIRRRMAEGKRGRSLSPEHRASISKATRGKPKAPEHAAKMAQARRGKRHSPEAIEKMAAIKRGKKMPAEVGARISERLKGNKHTLGFRHSEDTRAKLSAARRGQHMGNKFASGFVQSAETVAKRMAAHIGKKRSAESRERMVKAQLARWAKVRQAAA